ncbi:MAG: substrate-binding domain-containing protein, partial [Gammaproteobacteria bacterium]|nr:substrate-binding domain-containing protein [Gammaproteobacteria bacterium]
SEFIVSIFSFSISKKHRWSSRADELFKDFAGRSTSSVEKLSGTLKITSLAGVAPLIVPVIDKFHQHHSEIELEFIADEQLARLEHGEAHIAIRVGQKPTTPDYVVLPFRKISFGLYASDGYIEREGKPNQDNLTSHKFVGPQSKNSPLPYAAWLDSEIPKDAFVLRTTNQQVITNAIQQGLGIGFVAEHEAHIPRLVEITAPKDMWSVSLWIVTHADLRRTLKVQEFLKFARA